MGYLPSSETAGACRVKIIYLSVAIALVLPAMPAGATDVATVLESLPMRDGIGEIDSENLRLLLDYGIEQELTIFEVLNETAIDLINRNVRAHISGETLRDLDLRYDLGGDRVYALLPVSKITDVYIGAKSAEGEAALEVLLAEEHETRLENESLKLLDNVRIVLSARYGFETVTAGNFLEGFGAAIRRPLFGFRLDRVEIYEKNKIAIWTRGFSRPKRWRIRLIRRLE